MQTVKINNLEIPLTINHSSKAKHIGLMINTNGLKLTIPVKAKGYNIDEIINQKSNWIYKHYHKIQSTRAEEKLLESSEIQSLLYLDEIYPISIHYYDAKKISLRFSDKTFNLYFPKDINVLEKNQLITKIAKAWYKKTALDNIKNTVEKYANIMGLKYNTIKVKDQKTRWGSCSKKGNLNFCWRLIMAPQWIIDYVVIHELSHLKHMNHSKEFWKYVCIFMPDYSRAKVWFKENGAKLMKSCE